HMLNPQNTNHLWLLHTLFLDNINQDCFDFQAEWNCHPIWGPDTNDNNLNFIQDLWFLGQTLFSMYHDNCEGVHPNIIAEYYGIHGCPASRQPHQTGAGHPAGEEDNVDDPSSNIIESVNDQQWWYVHHEAVGVPSHRITFGTDKETQEQFFAVLAEVITKQITPAHCRLTPDEWEGEVYPVFETICAGQRGSKELQVSLTEPIWFHRVKLWCQALLVLTTFLANRE
ncbi:hypothetical protein DEU56DRAFT_722171, partial [Suillus clintonianus]|uniref:uncharacterized protein n=1 Tax=Suillus clintonianus TaxID=1904413 RepID=UPI001B879F17